MPCTKGPAGRDPRAERTCTHSPGGPPRGNDQVRAQGHRGARPSSVSLFYYFGSLGSGLSSCRHRGGLSCSICMSCADTPTWFVRQRPDARYCSWERSVLPAWCWCWECSVPPSLVHSAHRHLSRPIGHSVTSRVIAERPGPELQVQRPTFSLCQGAKPLGVRGDMDQSDPLSGPEAEASQD